MKELEEVIKNLEQILSILKKLADTNDSQNPAFEDVQKRLADISRDGYTSDIRELIEKYGGKKLSDISPDKYSSLLKEAEGLYAS